MSTGGRYSLSVAAVGLAAEAVARPRIARAARRGNAGRAGVGAAGGERGGWGAVARGCEVGVGAGGGGGRGRVGRELIGEGGGGGRAGGGAGRVVGVAGVRAILAQWAGRAPRLGVAAIDGLVPS